MEKERNEREGRDMYSITGATGHIGRRIAETLLGEGEPVRAIGRDRVRLQSLEQRGAEIWVGDLHDTEFLNRAFTDAKAVFVMIPPDMSVADVRKSQEEVGVSIVNAIASSGVKYVVNLSSLGAELERGTGPVLGLHDQEERLNRLEGVNVLHLRPTFFMENMMSTIPMLRCRGVFGTALSANVRIPMIATRDIATVAVRRLLSLDFTGKSVRTLLGERDLTMTEVAKVFGNAIGQQDMKYVQFSYEETAKGMEAMGASHDMARSMVEMLRGINEEKVIAGTPRTRESTTSTSIEQFATRFAAEYAASYRKAA